MPTEQEVVTDINALKRFWYSRNIKFQEWYEYLLLTDQLAAKGMESYVSNEPQTFYNMAHYLLTKGELSHLAPISSESATELDRRARVHRGCQYLWQKTDIKRKEGGDQSFVDELAFSLLVLGWYSAVIAYDEKTGLLRSQLWSPAETFPRYSNGRMSACVHSYTLTEAEAIMKAEENNWNYTGKGTYSGNVKLDDYFLKNKDGSLFNQILIDDQIVTPMVARPEMKLLVAPVGGFPNKGSLYKKGGDWKRLVGRGIFEVNESVETHFNKQKTMLAQILRDTAQPITQEFSANPQATPEQLRERGALFHYGIGEAGLNRLPPPVLPMEMQANLMELRREKQKGSFNDAVYGMVEGQPGYALSLLATSSANQILYPYMDAKHFVISECDKFWLSNVRSASKSFTIKGHFIEELETKDIPEDVTVIVNSDVATPKDWMERATIANMLEKHLDEDTIITEILKMADPQGIKRRKKIDKALQHPWAEAIEMIHGFRVQAKYLDHMGDHEQAALFNKMADAAEKKLGIPPEGQGNPIDMPEIQAARKEGVPEEKTPVASSTMPPEERSAWTPQQLRGMVGKGKIETV